MIMKTKHTKGEWKVYSDQFASPFIGLNKDHKICEMDVMGDEANANAKLIAAAPDLLNALIKIMEIEQEVQRENYFDLPNRGQWDVVSELAEQAIKKATL